MTFFQWQDDPQLFECPSHPWSSENACHIFWHGHIRSIEPCSPLTGVNNWLHYTAAALPSITSGRRELHLYRHGSTDCRQPRQPLSIIFHQYPADYIDVKNVSPFFFWFTASFLTAKLSAAQLFFKRRVCRWIMHFHDADIPSPSATVLSLLPQHPLFPFRR